MSEHTPGPWRVAYDPYDRPIYVTSDSHGYVKLGSPYRKDAFDTDPEVACDYDPAEVEANARLIAAAPELLNQTRKLAWLASELHGGNDFSKEELWKMVQTAQGIFAKATGS